MVGFPEGDPFHQVEKYRARVELNQLKNPEAFRQVYEDILKVHGSSADTWVELITFER